MKKTIYIVAIVIIMGAGGAYLWLQGHEVKPTAPAIAPEGQTGGLVVKENKTLMGWLKRGKTVVCTLSAAEGSITVRVKDDKVRIDGLPYLDNMAGETITIGSSLTAGGWTYIWSGAKGTKYNIVALAEITAATTSADAASQAASEEDKISWEKWASDMAAAGTSYDCLETELSDNIFIPPVDVEFVDWTEVILSAQQTTQELQDLTATSSVDMETIEKKAEDLNAAGPADQENVDQ